MTPEFAETLQKFEAFKNQSKPETANEHMFRVTANKIRHALASDKIPTSSKHAIEDIISDATAESDVYIFHPDLVKLAFPMIMRELDFNYGKGILHSIQNILETLPVELVEELKQYEKRFDSKPETEEKEVLDLSEMCGEFLRTNEATAGEKPIPLSVLLSAVMKHPETPKPIYEALGDILIELPEDISERPEIIQETLNRLKESE